ncbi:ComEA family DNA-binding protein [Aquimarina muelleri]|uniref:ComEA family DNA-binding protein n=1 Tax=Aquimarina muelleri TaxID=279356 RepID=UPI003F68492B
MNTIKSYFEINSRFRNGIFLLSIILFTAIIGCFFYLKKVTPKYNLVELEEFQHQIDSIKKQNKKAEKEYKLKSFNPNFISDYKGYMLGISPTELDKLYFYRSQGKWINSVSEFKKVTQVSDSLLAVISPLFKFPEWKNNKTKIFSKKEYSVKSHSQKKDLNTVLAKELQEEARIPDFIAVRIIKYRNKIGGFIEDIQLKDISGLYDNQRNKILSLFTVKTSRKNKKLNINRASVKELIEIPYFDFELALDIKDFVKDNGDISNFDELLKIKGFPTEKIDRIRLYLTID